MVHEDIKQFLSPEYPKESRSESSQGFQYRYLVDTRVSPLDGGLPLVGDPWHKGLDITDLQHTPKIGGSVFDLLEVSTVRSLPSSGSTIGTNRKAKMKEERYQIRWLPQSLPLQKHPAFANLTGGDRTTFNRQILGWERELNEDNQANYRYAPRDSDGNVLGAVVTIASGTPAFKYVTLRLLGHENYVFFAPVWSRIGIYEGESPPPKGNIGQKGNPGTTPAPPDGWEWVKTDDSSERQGLAPRWTRTETWTGAKKVDYDIDQLFV